LVGYDSYGSVSNSYATGNVSGAGSYVGGLVGINFHGTIGNSYATGNVSAADGYAGGLVAGNFEGGITTSYATGNVTGMGNAIGGLVGYSVLAAISLRSYATGTVSGTAGRNNIGGLVGVQRPSSTISNELRHGQRQRYRLRHQHRWTRTGFNYYGSINSSYATGSVSGANHSIGGLVGQNNGGPINNTYATGSVSTNTPGSINIGGLPGASFGGSINNSHASGSVSGNQVCRRTWSGLFSFGAISVCKQLRDRQRERYWQLC
jgi:hypothetical protein